MKRFVIALILLWLIVPPAARADGPEDQYVGVYSLIQLGDTLAEKGQTAAALARYTEAQTALTRLQSVYPLWNPNMVHYRLRYLATKITQLPQTQAPTSTPPATATAAPAAPVISGNTESAVTPVVKTAPPLSPEAASQIKELQEQIRNLLADKSLVEAKLREALSARPAAVEPEEFAKAQEQIKGLQKENDSLKANLAEARTNVAAASGSKLEESLTEANRKITQLTEANATLAAEKLALQAQAKTGAVTDADTAALRDENALLKKQIAELKGRAATAPANEALELKLKEAETQIAALQSDKELLRLEKIALETRAKQLPVPVVAATTNSVSADTNAAPMLDSVTAGRIAQLEAQRDELQKSLEAATSDLKGRKKGKELAAHIEDMTRQSAALRARMEVLQARPVPFTADELAMLGKPDATLLMASAHTTGKKQPRELPASASMLLAEARRYYAARDLEKAEQKYQEILKLDEKNIITLADLASIQLDAGRTNEAEKNLKAALVIEPQDDHCLYILGRLRYQQGNFEDAFDYLSRAAQANPQNARIQNFIGLTLSEKGQRGPAETAFRKAIQLDPGFSDAHANLAVVYATQQPPLRELARWHYQKALASGHPPDLKLEALLEPVSAPAP